MLRAPSRGFGWIPHWSWWAGVAASFASFLALPAFVSEYALLQLSVIAVLSMLGVSEGFLWGFSGILSFGQTAFFGLGGYTYAVAALNSDHTALPLLGAIILPGLLAAIVGYFMI